MGTNTMSTQVSAFFSGARQRVLVLLFGQPSRGYYVTELINLAGRGYGSVPQKLTRSVRSDRSTQSYRCVSHGCQT